MRFPRYAHGHLGRLAAEGCAFTALPFVVLFWLAPFVSGTTIGADYTLYTLPQQLILQFSLRNGSFPLFLPGFAGGSSASAATLGQLHHPISHVAAHLPGYWSGSAYEIYTALCLVSLGLAQWALFRLLRELDIDAVLSFVGSFVAVYDLRMLDLFRYGASLQSYVGYLLLCVAVTRVYLHGPRLGRDLCVVAATYLVVCGGHPQMAYLGLGGGLVVLCLAPFVLRPIVGRELPRPLTRSAAHAVAAVAVGLLLAAAYLLPLYFDFVAQAPARVGREFRWVYFPHRASLPSLLDSVFEPFASDVHGSFAGPAAFAVALLVPALAVVERLPAAIVALWGTVAVLLLLPLAPAVPLYYLLWKYVPLFSAFRVPGRTTLLLVFPLLLLLAWAFRPEAVRIALLGRQRSVPRLALLAGVAAVVYALYPLLPSGAVADTWAVSPQRIHAIPEPVVDAVFLLGVASLGALALYAWSARRALALGVVLGALVVAQAILLLRFGTWTAPKLPSPTYAEIAQRQRLELGYADSPGAGMENAELAGLRRARPRQHARIHWNARPVVSHDDAISLLRAQPRRAVVERPDAAQTTLPDPSVPAGEVSLLHASFNRLVFDVDTTHAGLLVTAYPFSPRWRVTVREVTAPTYRANGAWLAFDVPPGRSRVELLYVSRAAIAGTLLGCLVAWLLAVHALRHVRRRALRHAAIALATALVVGAFLDWQHGLHGGADLGTTAAWSLHPPEAPSR